MNDWNMLPNEVVSADSVNSFKNRLDKINSDRYFYLKSMGERKCLTFQTGCTQCHLAF